LDHGPRHSRAPRLDLGGNRGSGSRFDPKRRSAVKRCWWQEPMSLRTPKDQKPMAVRPLPVGYGSWLCENSNSVIQRCRLNVRFARKRTSLGNTPYFVRLAREIARRSHVMLASHAVDSLPFADHTSDNLPPGLLFVAPANLDHRWYALDDDWVQRLRPRCAWIEPVRAALALKIRNVLVGQLDVMLALLRQQRVRLGMPVYDDVRLHFGRIEERHPAVGQRCTAQSRVRAA
jgi:hypothetical protein